jgi:transposase-like protein
MGVVSVVLLCDGILKQSNEVLTLTYRLEALANLSLCEYEELEAFIDFVQNNLPRFRIARFFSVDRSILFKMLDSSIAFFLVLLQVYKN